jgi:tRNA (adenine57-N1/adenine58-N1)-methyltransferase
VFNGYPEETKAADITNGDTGVPCKRRRRRGGVYSFEFHAPRAKQLGEELEEHGLGSLVTVTNRDVYGDGFCLDDNAGPDADVIFLDLPAPWLALKHLTRSPPSQAVLKSMTEGETPTPEGAASTQQSTTEQKPFRSPLNPHKAVRICTFSPCIEQVTKTVSAMRALGWLEIGMAEIQAKRLEVRRERVGLQEEGLRGANPSAASVQEAVQRLRDVEGRAKIFHGLQKEKQEEVMRRAEAKKRGEKVPTLKEAREAGKTKSRVSDVGAVPPSKHDRLEKAKKELEKRELFKEGRLIHRTEPELKTHTSYLVFAVLPREWSREAEEKAARKWG